MEHIAKPIELADPSMPVMHDDVAIDLIQRLLAVCKKYQREAMKKGHAASAGAMVLGAIRKGGVWEIHRWKLA